MTFFWKLYLSIILFIMSCFSIGGTFFIQNGFQISLEREIENNFQENEAISQILKNQQIDILLNSQSTLSMSIYDENIQEMMIDISIEGFNGTIQYCLRNQDGEVLYMDGLFYNDSSMINQLSSNQQGYIITQDEDQYYLHTIRHLGDEIYIENRSEVTLLFQNKDAQFQLLLTYSIILLCVCTIIIYILSRWLMKPIQQLTHITQNIATGESYDLVEVKGHDEISQLTTHFNIMLERLLKSLHDQQETIERQNLFIGNFAHEIKTPLTTVIGYADILRSKPISEDQMRYYSNYIVNEGKRLERLSMKLLHLIVLKKKDFQFQDINTLDYLEDIKEATLLLSYKDIEMTYDFEEDIISIEPDLMKTVILNLVENARKAIDQKGIIKIIGRKEKEGYLIQVKDNGCGISQENLSRIKEAFYQVDQSRHQETESFGLGLAIVDEIIQSHHASLTFESEVHKGTTVSIVLKGGHYAN